MKKEFEKEVDAWIKDIRKDVVKISEIEKIVNINVDNIQHNYELIKCITDDINDIRTSLDFMRWTLLFLIKKEVQGAKKISRPTTI